MEKKIKQILIKMLVIITMISLIQLYLPFFLLVSFASDKLIMLNTPTDVKLNEDCTASWKVIPNATSYKVYCNIEYKYGTYIEYGKSYDVEKGTIKDGVITMNISEALYNAYNKYYSGETINISIRVVASDGLFSESYKDSEFSESSNTIEYINNGLVKLDTPVNIILNKDYIASWNVVPNATRYKVYCDIEYMDGTYIEYGKSYDIEEGIIKDGVITINVSEALYNAYNKYYNGETINISIRVIASDGLFSKSYKDSEFSECSNTIYYIPDGTSTFNISGTISSYNSEIDDITIQLYREDATEIFTETNVVGNNANYMFQNIPAGNYKIRIMKNKHCTREYTITVDKSNIIQDIQICLIGDINEDGKVNIKDWNMLYNHINETNLLTEYKLLCADVNKDGKVNIKDWNRLNNHITEVDPLY